MCVPAVIDLLQAQKSLETLEDFFDLQKLVFDRCVKNTDVALAHTEALRSYMKTNDC